MTPSGARVEAWSEAHGTQKSRRRPNSIQRALLVRFAGVNVLVMTPKEVGLVYDSPGVVKLWWLKTLNKSAEKPSVIGRSLPFNLVSLPNRISMLRNGRPRMGLARPV